MRHDVYDLRGSCFLFEHNELLFLVSISINFCFLFQFQHSKL